MKCRASSNKSQSNTRVVEFFLNAAAYTLFEHGLDKDDVLKILTNIEEVADSMVKSYVTFSDIRKVLKDEYDFTINLT